MKQLDVPIKYLMYYRYGSAWEKNTTTTPHTTEQSSLGTSNMKPYSCRTRGHSCQTSTLPWKLLRLILNNIQFFFNSGHLGTSWAHVLLFLILLGSYYIFEIFIYFPLCIKDYTLAKQKML